jgi:hypothetical protein
MSLAIPCLFLGPYQTPLYSLPIDTVKFHPMLFATAHSFISGTRNLEELELLYVLANYCIFVGRQGMIASILGIALDVMTQDGWLDENSPTWRDLTGNETARARLVVTEVVAGYK